MDALSAAIPLDDSPARANALVMTMDHLVDLLSAIVHRLHAALTTLLLFIVSLGPIPRHVGFVMDGNRRYAKGRGRRVAEGHSDGFDALKRTLEICLRLRIRAVSIYAFSIDNFKRDEKEVEALFRLAKTKLMELCQHDELLNAYGIRLRWIGRRDMFPPDMTECILKMEQMTEHNTAGVLNVCSPYTSRDEMTTAMRHVVDGEMSTFNSKDIFNHLETTESIRQLNHDAGTEGLDDGRLDILVRTSNVKRLSDFMMWQASEDTQLHFVQSKWPEFSLTDFLPILLGWQQKKWLRSIRRTLSIS
ncbi:putative undecaprenyl diphosphate synthase-domain-containing protein [Kockovaella imperatae]|uniref:Alkyl transferase n=1 Tax=Kockovaella imperatae TaxID=4999 RepID=A0A1Y1UPT2_9TREE|nr:putative undecaprenyl diphosphate synthase-domain-containing protein [Kockovaella imperatae]ORX40033.1 putative undecaprenyl diphosphate synthase-domain-containing protein [Kockovaella imperatae]